jgi:asparagine synthase (glutamine-hydrolysing)
MLSREYEIKTHLLSLLDRNDKMGMANSVEIRAPFLDREILGLCLALPDSDLVVNGSPKYVMKQIFARCFPDMKVQEKKIGFRVPFDEVFLEGRRRGRMRDYCEVAVRALR